MPTSICLLVATFLFSLSPSSLPVSPATPPAVSPRVSPRLSPRRATTPATGWLRLSGSEAEDSLDFAAVDAALENARELMNKGKWKKAKETLVDFLAEAGAEDALVVRWPFFADGLKACTFWSNYEVPDSDEVVPQLLSWKERTGDLKLRYKRGEAGDFLEIEQEDGESVYLHPMRFTGPYSIEFRGRSLQAAPVVYIDWFWGSIKNLTSTSYAVVFGEQTSIWEFSGNGASQVDSAPASLSFERPYSFEVKVASNSVTASYNGKRLLKIKRPKGDYGQFGLVDLDAFEEVQVVGEVEPAWITGLVEAEVAAAFARFEEGYDPVGEASTALRERIKGEAKEAADFGLACPGDQPEGDETVLSAAKVYVDEEEFTDGLKWAKTLGSDGASEVVRDWILANFQLYAGDAEEAYATLERVAEADPEFYEGRLYRTWMSRTQEGQDDSLLEHEKLILDFPDHVEPYEALALFHLYEGRAEEAAEVLQVAVQNGVPMSVLHDVGITLLRERQGPAWPDVETYASKNYRVFSNAGKRTCVKVATELDETLRSYEREMGRVQDKDVPKFAVYFFAAEAGYQSYCKDLLGAPAESTLGLFHPALKQLLVWDSSDPGSTMRTVRHEGFHQYFDRLVGDSPVWLNEGMAEYYEQARFVGGRWKEGQVNEEHVALLRATRKNWTPLETFVRMDNRAFRAKSSLHYAQGWAFVHFMKNSGRGSKQIFDALLDGLKEGGANADVIEAAFEGVDFRQLETDFRSYVLDLG